MKGTKKMTSPQYNSNLGVDVFVTWVRGHHPNALEAITLRDLIGFVIADCALALHRNGDDVRGTIDDAVLIAARDDFGRITVSPGVYDDEPEPEPLDAETVAAGRGPDQEQAQ